MALHRKSMSGKLKKTDSISYTPVRPLVSNPIRIVAATEQRFTVQDMDYRPSRKIDVGLVCMIALGVVVSIFVPTESFWGLPILAVWLVVFLWLWAINNGD